MDVQERDELARLAGELERSAGRLPFSSMWRARLLKETRLLRAASCLPVFTTPSPPAATASGLRLIEGERGDPGRQ